MAWGPSAIISLAAVGAGLLAWAAAAAGARWSRWRARRRIRRRIGEVYALILARAEAAKTADYLQPPPEAFALYHTLREELFELGQVGSAIQLLKDAVMRAAAEESPGPTSTILVKGAAPIWRHGPPPESATDPQPAEALRNAVLDFCDYWSRRSKVEADLVGVLRNLGADAPADGRQARGRGGGQMAG